VQDGIAFTYDGITSDTTDSHRLAEKAWELGGWRLQASVWVCLSL
jgi:hypothetical protein